MTTDPTPAVTLTSRELGHRWMLWILGALYEGWPARYNFDAFSVAKETGTLGAEGGLTDEQLANWSGLITWLARENMITIGGSSTDGHVMAAQLTAKGHDVLQKPAPGTPETTMASRVTEFAKAGTKTAGGEAAKEIGKATGRELAELAGTLIGSIGKSLSGS